MLGLGLAFGIDATPRKLFFFSSFFFFLLLLLLQLVLPIDSYVAGWFLQIGGLTVCDWIVEEGGFR